MRILAIDPGTTESAYVIMVDGEIVAKGKTSHDCIINLIQNVRCDILAIEMIASYGMPVGREIFETCVWIGEYRRAAKATHGYGKICMVYRRDVKLHLCGTTKAKDGNIRQALIDRFPASGGGRVPQIGTKGQPGKLYGVSADIWAALAVAMYTQDIAR